MIEYQVTDGSGTWWTEMAASATAALDAAVESSDGVYDTESGPVFLDLRVEVQDGDDPARESTLLGIAALLITVATTAGMILISAAYRGLV